MKKVCVVTAARSEYGPMQWILKALQTHPGLRLQLVVTGAHLSSAQGMTVNDIEADGFLVDARVDMQLDTANAASIAASMGRCAQGMATALSALAPDLLLVLGDRYELLPICSTALVMGIPIAHISGGDITEGAIDDRIRNAVTMMASLHFPGTLASAENIIRMTGSEANVFPVGEPGLESFLRFSLMDRSALAADLGLDINAKWVLLTLHPETKASREYNMALVGNMLEAIDGFEECQFIITGANADLCGDEMNRILSSHAAASDGRMVFRHNLGHKRYLGMMHQAALVLGNSSSGIIEAPFLGIPVVNVGRRQRGRHECSNVLTVGNSAKEIRAGISRAISKPRCPDYYYGDGHAADAIVRHIEDFLK